jgi:hypothetical protein
VLDADRADPVQGADVREAEGAKLAASQAGIGGGRPDGRRRRARRRLESAYGRGVKVLALDVPERETILRALDDPPAGLEELRGVLLGEVEWRRREGL